MAEAIKTHPLVLSHGTSKEQDPEDTIFTSARVTDQVYARRRAQKEGKPWRQVSWEDTQCGYATVGMDPYVGMKPSADTLTVTIEPHTVQSVTFMTRKK